MWQAVCLVANDNEDSAKEAENSIPEIKRIPLCRHWSFASCKPAIVSWSVNEIIFKPFLARISIKSEGAFAPSLLFEWQWRFIFILKMMIPFFTINELKILLKKPTNHFNWPASNNLCFYNFIPTSHALQMTVRRFPTLTQSPTRWMFLPLATKGAGL